MSSKEKNSSEKKDNKVEESSAAFKTVRVFNSFEEAEEYETKQRAELSYDERLKHVEELRKRVFHQYLEANGNWPPISKTFKITKPHIHDPGQ